jgi:hypothetical protein
LKKVWGMRTAHQSLVYIACLLALIGSATTQAQEPPLSLQTGVSASYQVTLDVEGSPKPDAGPGSITEEAVVKYLHGLAEDGTVSFSIGEVFTLNPSPTLWRFQPFVIFPALDTLKAVCRKEPGGGVIVDVTSQKSFEAGQLTASHDTFPIFPAGDLRRGDRWTVRLSCSVPLALPHRVPLEVEHVFAAVEKDGEEQVAVVKYSTTFAFDSAQHRDVLKYPVDIRRMPVFRLEGEGEARFSLWEGTMLSKKQRFTWKAQYRREDEGDEDVQGRADAAPRVYESVSTMVMRSRLIPEDEAERLVKEAQERQAAAARAPKPPPPQPRWVYRGTRTDTTRDLLKGTEKTQKYHARIGYGAGGRPQVVEMDAEGQPTGSNMQFQTSREKVDAWQPLSAMPADAGRVAKRPFLATLFARAWGVLPVVPDGTPKPGDQWSVTAYLAIDFAKTVIPATVQHACSRIMDAQGNERLRIEYHWDWHLDSREHLRDEWPEEALRRGRWELTLAGEGRADVDPKTMIVCAYWQRSSVTVRTTEYPEDKPDEPVKKSDAVVTYEYEFALQPPEAPKQGEE